jgi:hypothetical protein
MDTILNYMRDISALCLYGTGSAEKDEESSRGLRNMTGVAADHHSIPSAGIALAYPPPVMLSNKTIRIYSELNGACDNVNITHIYVILCCIESVTC